MPNLQNNFEAWATYATLAGLEMPPPIGTLCRSGPQFRAFTNPVIFYEAGIGTSKLASDSVPFRKVLHNSQRQQKVFQRDILWCIICFFFLFFEKQMMIRSRWSLFNWIFQVVEPCIPCFTKCYRFNCDSNCTSTETVQKTFVLDNINLPTKKTVYNDTGHGVEEIITYYLTGKSWTLRCIAQ